MGFFFEWFGVVEDSASPGEGGAPALCQCWGDCFAGLAPKTSRANPTSGWPRKRSLSDISRLACIPPLNLPVQPRFRSELLSVQGSPTQRWALAAMAPPAAPMASPLAFPPTPPPKLPPLAP